VQPAEGTEKREGAMLDVGMSEDKIR